MDFFASHMVSLILSWVFCSFIFIGLMGYLGETFFEKVEDIPRVVTIWLSLCLIVLSPLRYILLQLTIGTAYPFQSISAFVSTLLLAMYIPIVFGIIYALGFALPLLGILFAGMREPVTKAKMLLLCVLAPVGCLFGSYLFTMILPYAAMSIHWLKVRDVIRSTNGPAYYFHKYAVDVWNPMDLFVDDDQRNQSLREHIGSLYFGKKQKASYQRIMTWVHFSQSLSYAMDGFKAFEDGMPKNRSLIVSIDKKVIDEVIRLNKLALAVSRFVSIEELNDWYPGLGYHYRDEFIAGLEGHVKGYERNESLTTMRGQFLLNNWGNWYIANREKILQSKKK